MSILETRIRVAALMDTVQVSGPGRQLAALIPPLAAAGVDLRVVLFHRQGRPPSPYADFLRAAGVDHVVVPDRGRFDVRVVSRVAAVLREWRPDIVQTHSYRPTAIAWALRRRGADWKWLGFFHGATNENLKVRLYHRLDRALLPRADRIIVMARSQAALFGGRRVVQVRNAVLPDVAASLPPDTAARLAGLARPRIGVIGRLSHEKGVDLFLQAFRRLRADGVAATAVIAGDGPERAALHSAIAQLGLADQVHLLGPLYPAGPLYPELDLVVIPSRSEGLPNVLLEALQADRRVVSTDVGAVREVLAEPEAGRVVPSGDAGAIARAMKDALAEPASAGSSARRAAVERFSLARRVDAHVAVYDAVLGRVPAPVAGGTA